MNTRLQQLINALGYTRAFHLDFETFSEIDISAGTVAYASHPSTEILLAAYAYDNDEPDLWSRQHRRSESHKARKREIKRACTDRDVILIAWNAPFEREILRHVWGIETPANKWLDAMVCAYAMSLPGSLDGASKILGLDADKAKMSVGKKLIQKFCKLQPKNRKIRRHDWNTDPEDWKMFGQYCVGDVIAERACLNRTAPFLLRPQDVEDWWRDQRVNERGMPIDTDLVDAAIEVDDDLKTQLKKECAILTGLDNPNSIPQFLPWIQGEGYEGDSLKKDRVEIELRGDSLTEIGRRAISLRAQFSRSSTSKFPKIKSQTVDGRLRYTLQFNGAARTGRWSGRGAQFQNLPRPPKSLEDPKSLDVAIRAVKTRDPDFLRELYDQPVDTLAGCIRPCLRAQPGYILRVADYNAIENRVLGWLTQCDAILDVFRNGLDPYKDFGTRMYHKPYDEITKKERTNSKPAVLGAGYMLGGGREKVDKKTGVKTKTGLWAYSEALGVNLSREESHRAVQIFRDAYPEVVEFWDVLSSAFWQITVKKRGVKRIPVGFSGQYLELGYVKPALYIQLPSGRRLWYVRPRIQRVPMPWEDDEGKTVWRDGITYEGQNQTTGRWERTTTHPGKLTENVTQAAACDYLRHGIKNAEEAGFSGVLHVHDELVTEELIDDPERTVEHLETVLCDPPEWALDLPMKAEGYESPFYMKD